MEQCPIQCVGPRESCECIRIVKVQAQTPSPSFMKHQSIRGWKLVGIMLTYQRRHVFEFICASGVEVVLCRRRDIVSVIRR